MMPEDFADRIISRAAAGHLGWHEQRRLIAEAVREAVAAAERERDAYRRALADLVQGVNGISLPPWHAANDPYQAARRLLATGVSS